jgi:hypothetical protein
MRSVPVAASCDQVRNSGILLTATMDSGRRWPLLISTITSVPPASTNDVGSAASAASASSRDVETNTLISS